MLLIIIVWDLEIIKSFKVKYGDVIFKLFYGNGGVGVFWLDVNDCNLILLYEFFIGFSCELLIV